MRLEILLKVRVIYQSRSFIFYSIDCGRDSNGNPLRYSCLENPMDRGAWLAAVHGINGSQTQLSDFTFTFHFHALGKEMATHSSILAWRIPGTGSLVAAISGVTQSRTRLKQLSSSSINYGASLVAQLVKNLPAMRETWV